MKKTISMTLMALMLVFSAFAIGTPQESNVFKEPAKVKSIEKISKDSGTDAPVEEPQRNGHKTMICTKSMTTVGIYPVMINTCVPAEKYRCTNLVCLYARN